MTWLSHMLDCQLFGTEPGSHHLTNLLLHITSSLLLFGVLKKMTGALWPSAFVAAAFALHPLHVESVAWVSERKDVLSTVFWMLTMGAYVRYVERPAISRYLLTLSAFALGLMAKPMLVTMPFVLLLLDYWPLGRMQYEQPADNADNKSTNTRSQCRLLYHFLREKIPFFVLTAVSSVITFVAQQNARAVAPFEVFPLTFRIANAAVSHLKYIQKMIWPSGLAVIYQAGAISVWEAAISVVLLVLISRRVIGLAQSHKYMPVGWMWYLVTLVPVIGLVQVGDQALADRYTYVPLIGLFIIIAWGVPDMLQKWQRRRLIIGALAIIVLSSLSVCTYLQQSHWRNSITLFRHAISATEDNYKAHFGLATALLRKGEPDEAAVHFERVLQIRPNYPKVYNNLAILMRQKGQITEAIEYFRKAIEIEPDDFKSRYNLGILLAKEGEFDEAIEHFRRAVRIRPYEANARYNFGILLDQRGQTDEAISEYRAALQINPNFVKARAALNAALARKQMFRPAVEPE
ncbi:MAG: tetratricopeptide repeat protein [Planctomycetota bacterium]